MQKTEKKSTEEKRSSFCGSLLKWLELGQLKLGLRNFILVFLWQGPKDMDHLPCLPWHPNRELCWKWGSQNFN